MAADSQVVSRMRKMKFYRRWKRRFRAGLESTQTLFSNCLQSGDPEVIHDLRVTLRRARLLALVGTPVLGKTGATQFRHWALILANALGRIRDYDATLEWLKMHSPAGQQESVLRQQRDQVWRLTLPKLRRL